MKLSRGFTLIEMIMALSIMAVLITLAAPSFQQVIAANRLTAATNDLYTSLTQARTDAVRQGRRVTICASSDTVSCNVTNTWATGWIGFTDTTRAVLPSVDAGETVTFVNQGMHPSLQIIGNASVAQYVSFSPDGQSKQINGGFQAGTIRICNTSEALADDARARDIVISISGRAVINRPAGVASNCPAP